MYDDKPLWVPSRERVASARPDAFWRSVWEFCGIRGDIGTRIVVDRRHATEHVRSGLSSRRP